MTIIKLFISIFGLCVLVQNLTSTAWALPSYRLTDLTALGGGFSGSANSINDNGIVVGNFFSLADGITSAFTFDARNPGAGLQILGSLGGSTSTALGVSNNGHVAGILVNSTAQIRAFSFNTNNPGAGLQQIGTLGGEVSQGRDVNNSGLLVGSSSNAANRTSRAFTFDTNNPSDGLKEIGSLGGELSVAHAVNDNGLIVGQSHNSIGQTRAFTFDTNNPGAGLQDLGTIGGISSEAHAVSNNGLVVGRSLQVSPLIRTHAMIFDTNNPSAGMRDLGTLPGGSFSEALGVNDSGLVVGRSLDGNNLPFRAFIFDTAAPSGIMRDLNDLIDPEDPLFGQVELEFAFDINKFGDIAARGEINGRTHAFLLTATREVSVAEPAIFSVFGIGFAGLIVMRRRRNLA